MRIEAREMAIKARKAAIAASSYHLSDARAQSLDAIDCHAFLSPAE